MKKIVWLFTGLLILMSACSSPSVKEDQNIVQLKALFDEVKLNPDRRSRIFEATFAADTTAQGVVYVAKGATTQPEAKAALAAAAADKGIKLLDSIKLLPDPALGEKTYGITSLSVTNVRANPSHSAEMDTQLLMGMPVRILETRGSWWRIVTPEGYISWSNVGVRAMTQLEYDIWTKADKMIITTHYTLFREQPSATATIVCDGVWGNVVRADGESGAYYKVILPTGQSAFVPKKDAQKFNDWLKQRKFFTVETKVFSTAQEIVQYRQEITKIRDTLPYDIDGLVVKDLETDMEDLRKARPEKQIAFKFELETAFSVLREVLWSESGSTYTPIGVIDPVRLAGTTVKRANLNNPAMIRSMGLKIGSVVSVVKRGEIIPKIEGLAPPGAMPVSVQAGEELIEIIFPQVCAVCYATLVDAGTRLY